MLAAFSALLVICIMCLPLDRNVECPDDQEVIRGTGSLRLSGHQALRSRQISMAAYGMEPTMMPSYPRLLQADATEGPDEVLSDPIATQTIPAALLGIASVLFIASLLSVAQHFLEWRYCCIRRNADELHSPEAEDIDQPKEITEGSSAMVTTRTSNESSSEERQDSSKPTRNLEFLEQHEYFYPVRHILPPLPADICDLDATLYPSPYQESLSRVSTLTFEECRDEQVEAIDFHGDDAGTREKVHVRGSNAPAVTELSDQFRLPCERDTLTKLLYQNHKKRASPQDPVSPTRHIEDDADSIEEDDQSSTSTAHSEGEDTSEVVGITCLHEEVTPTKTRTGSLSYRSLEFSPDTPEAKTIARDIAMVGRLLFQDNNVGLGLDESEHLATSSVSDTEEGSDAKVTIMSSRCDDTLSEDDDEDSDLEDLGVPESCVEL